MFSVISRTLVGGGFLTLCGDAVGVFYSPNWLGYRTLVAVVGGGGEGFLTLCIDAVGVILQPEPTRLDGLVSYLGHLLVKVPLRIEVVSVFCSPNWLHHKTLVSGGRGFTPLQEDGLCILLPHHQPTWL